MTLLALTGGIASGKSTIAAQLVALGAVHVDADQLARLAVAPGSTGLAAIVAVFGDDMLTEAGELNRPKLGELVFSDEESLRILNSIVHPEVRALADQQIAEGLVSSKDAVVLYDVPLLVESGVSGNWDAVIVAEAPEAIRHDRLVSLRGMAPEEATKRINNQATDEQRRRVADVIVDTSGSLAETERQVNELWESLVQGSLKKNWARPAKGGINSLS